MKSVFLGGSRRLSRLAEEVRRRLQTIMDRGLWVYVGDANGADHAFQAFLAEHGYDRVVVYCVEGKHRNNVGHWQTRAVTPPSNAKGFEYYASKDVQMAVDASYGLMLWDGISRGTLANIRNLLAHGKPVAVYLSPVKAFRDLRREAELGDLALPTPKAKRRPPKTHLDTQRELPLRTRAGKGNVA